MILNFHNAVAIGSPELTDILVNSESISWVQIYRRTVRGETKDYTVLHMNTGKELLVTESFEDVKQALDAVDVVKLLGR